MSQSNIGDLKMELLAAEDEIERLKEQLLRAQQEAFGFDYDGDWMRDQSEEQIAEIEALEAQNAELTRLLEQFVSGHDRGAALPLETLISLARAALPK